MCVITLVLNAFTKEIQATMMTILRKLWYSRRGKIYYLTLTVILMYNIISYYNRDLPYYQPEIPEVNSDELVIFSARDLESLAQKIPQLPIQQLIGNKFSKIKYKSGNNKCAISPPLLWELQFNNNYWQIFKTKAGGSIYLYGAYYDDRFASSKQKIFVHLSVMVDRVQLPPVFCQLWLNKEKKQFVTPAIFRSLWPSIWGNFKDGELLPHLISCLLPIQMGSSVPNSVSLVGFSCQNATNNLNVFHMKEKTKKKNEFAVCVKGLTFRHLDISLRLIEWIELLKILGVTKIHFYELVLHPNVAKVLSYYEERGTVKVTKLSLPGNQPNFPETIGIYQKFAIFRKRQNEVIPYNDCFYRNVHLYDYIALLDVDEIILPTSPNSFTWNDMMSSVTDRNKDAICARNIYFYEKLETKNNHIPRHLHMLRHSIRSINYTKPPFYVKCLHNASSVITLHNHLPVVCASKDKKNFAVEGCNYRTVAREIAQLQHYKGGCTIQSKNICNELDKTTIEDTTIHRYASTLINNTEIVIKELGF